MKLFGVFLLLAGVATGQQSATDRFQNAIVRFIEAFNASDYGALRRDFSPEMSTALPPEKAASFFKELAAQHGKILKVDAPRTTSANEAIFPAKFERGRLDITLVLNDQDKITGLLVLPHTDKLLVPVRNETPLSLPLRGRWLVAWGGDTREQNQHHDTLNQRFAFDFVGVDERGRTHKGEGMRNSDFYAFGQEVLAPAEGEVTEVITGVRDNAPGSMNPYSALGNAVILLHREHEVSVLAHLQFGSIRVKVGDKVKRGQVVALCGNSGNTSEPHLHYHLQNTPVIQDGVGIKCCFEKVRVTKEGNTESKSAYSPLKGEIVSSE